MAKPWTSDPNAPAVPDEFFQMRQVAVLPLGPDWFEGQGVAMKEEEIEDNWPLLYGTIRTDAGTFIVVGTPGADSVEVWASRDMTPQEAADELEATLEHGAESTVFDSDAGYWGGS
jgi:hypothetical protein